MFPINSILYQNFIKNNTLKPENIPPDLKKLRQWVLWKAKETKKGITKPPFQTSGRKAKTNDTSTWASYNKVLTRYQGGGYDGIGFMLHDDGPFVGVDLDHCVVDGVIETRAQNIVDKLNSYAEISPSQTGVRIFIKAKLPEGGRKRGPIEMYESRRFLTVTGRHIPGTPATIETRQQEIEAIHKMTFPTKEKKEHTQHDLKCDIGTDDNTLIEKIRSSKNGGKFSSLWSGDTGAYESHSEADQALCNLLAFWTGRDPDRIDGLFRQSGLMRNKWNEKHFSDGRTYGEATIKNAVDGCSEVYTPRNSIKDPQGKPQAEQTAAQIVRLADVAPTEVSWVWPPYIPRGKLTLVEGDPSVGKTWLALQLAAIISRGWPFPDRETGKPTGGAEPGNVLYMSAEDGLSDTLRPRLDKLGGDCDNIYMLTGSMNEEGKIIGVTLGDLEIIEEALQRVKPTLLVVDPLQAYLGARLDMHRANEVRPVLTGLANLAEKYGCAAIAIRHLSKASQGRALYRGMGSIDFAAAARSILLVGQDPDTPQNRAIVQTKNSLEEQGPSMGYEIKDGKFLWTGISELTASSILKPEQTDEEKSAAEVGQDFLEDILQDGAVPADEIFKESRKQKIADRTLYRVKACMKIDSQKIGKCWYWELPKRDFELEI